MRVIMAVHLMDSLTYDVQTVQMAPLNFRQENHCSCVCLVEEDALVFGVGDLFPALQSPHRLPHVFGLQRRSVSPLLTDIQSYTHTHFNNSTNTAIVILHVLNRNLLTFFNNLSGEHFGDAGHGDNDVLRHR